jgi:cleavage and polyadenylation specificity factor subunit 1
MQALRNELLPPSGVQFATSLRLLPYTVCRRRKQYTEPSEQSSLCNLVTARSNILRIYEIVEETVMINQSHAKTTRDADAVEGEVEMDTQGEGFVNMGSVKVFQLFFCCAQYSS